MELDADWCMACEKQIPLGQAYCNSKCKNADKLLKPSTSNNLHSMPKFKRNLSPNSTNRLKISNNNNSSSSSNNPISNISNSNNTSQFNFDHLSAGPTAFPTNESVRKHSLNALDYLQKFSTDINLDDTDNVKDIQPLNIAAWVEQVSSHNNTPQKSLNSSITTLHDLDGNVLQPKSDMPQITSSQIHSSSYSIKSTTASTDPNLTIEIPLHQHRTTKYSIISTPTPSTAMNTSTDISFTEAFTDRLSCSLMSTELNKSEYTHAMSINACSSTLLPKSSIFEENSPAVSALSIIAGKYSRRQETMVETSVKNLIPTNKVNQHNVLTDIVSSFGRLVKSWVPIQSPIAADSAQMESENSGSAETTRGNIRLTDQFLQPSEPALHHSTSVPDLRRHISETPQGGGPGPRLRTYTCFTQDVPIENPVFILPKVMAGSHGIAGILRSNFGSFEACSPQPASRLACSPKVGIPF